MSLSKQKILEIVLTAILSAGIAFLQSILLNYSSHTTIIEPPVIAGVIGATIRSFRC